MIVFQRIKIILHPFRRIINYVFFDALIFLIIPNDTVVIIGLKKMILPVVFWNIQMMFIDVTINFGNHGRFKTAMNDDMDLGLRVNGECVASLARMDARLIARRDARPCVSTRRVIDVFDLFFWDVCSAEKPVIFPGLIQPWNLLYPRMIVIQRIKIVIHPFFRIVLCIF
jgi:hypothetical protein